VKPLAGRRSWVTMMAGILAPAVAATSTTGIKPISLSMTNVGLRLGGARRDRRGSVALMVGLTAPVLVMALGLGIEVSRWSVAKVELQRIADAAALAGAFDYQHQATKVPRASAAAAANLAWLNKVTGTASPTWTAGTELLTDNLIAVQIIAGLRNASDTAVRVTVSRLVPLCVAGIFTSATTQMISATAVAELTAALSGPPACVLALQGDSNGITTTEDINLNNGVKINNGGCALRSDASVNLTGGATVDGNVVAAGQVSISNGASITSPYTGTSNSGQIPDPLAADPAVQNALQAAADASSPAENCNSGGGHCTISPGSFDGISVSNGATLTLAPGLYTVNGPVDFAGGTVNIQAGGVTIASSGTVTISNGVTVNGFSAATPGSAGVAAGAIPGVLLATSATNPSGSYAATFSGGASFAFAGVMYVPNGTLSISNGVSTTTPGCAEIVASDVNMSGGANFASGSCASTYGSSLPVIPSQLTTTAVLVQ
jgi:Flp pilus assembly protein TadG